MRVVARAWSLANPRVGLWTLIQRRIRVELDQDRRAQDARRAPSMGCGPGSGECSRGSSTPTPGSCSSTSIVSLAASMPANAGPGSLRRSSCEARDARRGSPRRARARGARRVGGEPGAPKRAGKMTRRGPFRTRSGPARRPGTPSTVRKQGARAERRSARGRRARTLAEMARDARTSPESTGDGRRGSIESVQTCGRLNDARGRASDVRGRLQLVGKKKAEKRRDGK